MDPCLSDQTIFAMPQGEYILLLEFSSSARELARRSLCPKQATYVLLENLHRHKNSIEQHALAIQ
eukprot:scaffold3450_cov114-Cylindrotheca_fusiformis.AAC.26